MLASVASKELFQAALLEYRPPPPKPPRATRGNSRMKGFLVY